MPEERRLVTVMFADVVGSTTLGEQLDAEDMRTMLSSYYSIAKDVVATYGGTLEKFIGDAVMGVFGLPSAHGDDAERAVRAALELRDRIRDHAGLSDLKLRFGICSGEVVASREPGADFLVTGDAVNVAARLQQAADSWAILVSDRTLAAAPPSFEVGPLLEISARGKGSPIAAREVLASLHIGPANRHPKAAMRGRQDELDQLVLIGRRAFRESRPAFVTIIGQAGTGKSRLLEEFLGREMHLIAPSTTVAIAQCLPYGSQLTYWPLRQVLFRLIGVAEDVAASDVRVRATAWLGNERFGDLLATSLGFGLGDAPDRADVFAAWRLALEKASAEQPLVLVFEDLHWSSDSLLDLVDFVMQSRSEARILMVALSRPELMDRRPSWGGGRRNFANLFLEPLADPDMRGLVGDLLEGAGEKTMDAVVSRAGGNPFYAEELVRSVISGRDVDTLPDTVQASIQARLDLLPDGERAVLRLGSIFGRTFRLTGVAALAPDLESSVESVCEELVRRDLVRQDGDDHLTFAHILIREVVYHSLTRSERARLHAAAGAWLESRAAGRESAVAELVAFHYREALSLLGRQRVAGFDEEDVKRKAVRWLSRAGDAAGAAGANLEAARHFHAAIDVASDEELPELYERLGDVEQLRRGSIEAYLKALESGKRINRSKVDELRVLGGLLMCVMRWAEGVGRFPLETVDRMRSEGRDLARQVDDPHSLAKFAAAESFYPWHVGREGGHVTEEMVADAEAEGRRAVTLAESISDWNTWSAGMDGITGNLMERRAWPAARDMAQQRVARQSELTVLERLDAHHMVAWSSFCLGDPTAMNQTLQGGQGLLDFAQNPSLILGLLGERMHALTLLGDWAQAIELGDRVLRVWAETHEALGPWRIGFLTGLELSRSLRDAVRARQFENAILETDRVAATSYLWAYAESGSSNLEQEVLTSIAHGYARADVIERLLSIINDSGRRMPRSTVEAILAWTDSWGLPLVKAQALRAAGDFTGAQRIWAEVGAVPYDARARIERAQSQGEQPDPGAVSVLRAIGDIEYLEAHQLGT